MGNVNRMIEVAAKWWADNLTTIHSPIDASLEDRLEALAAEYEREFGEKITGTELHQRFMEALIEEINFAPFREDDDGRRMTLYTDYYPCETLCIAMERVGIDPDFALPWKMWCRITQTDEVDLVEAEGAKILKPGEPPVEILFEVRRC